MEKSRIFPINKVTNMEALAMILGGEAWALPISYLGMPLGSKIDICRNLEKYIG